MLLTTTIDDDADDCVCAMDGWMNEWVDGMDCSLYSSQFNAPNATQISPSSMLTKCTIFSMCVPPRDVLPFNTALHTSFESPALCAFSPHHERHPHMSVRVYMRICPRLCYRRLATARFSAANSTSKSLLVGCARFLPIKTHKGALFRTLDLSRTIATYIARATGRFHSCEDSGNSLNNAMMF